jgi:hypothetical protein
MDETRVPQDMPQDIHQEMMQQQQQGENTIQVIAKARLEWVPPIEKLLASWCDHSKCFVWMHSRAHDETEKRLRRFMFIIHALSTVSGLSNIITGTDTIGWFNVSWIFGAITIFLTSLSLLQEKLGLQEKALNHRKLAFQSLMIKMKIEEILSLPREARGDCKTFLRYIKSDINHTMLEKNASIPLPIREECLLKFGKIPEFSVPDVCGQIEHTQIYKEEPAKTDTYFALSKSKQLDKTIKIRKPFEDDMDILKELEIFDTPEKYKRNTILPHIPHKHVQFVGTDMVSPI